MSFFLSLFGCNKTNSSEENLPNITNVENPEEDFKDIVLKIVEVSKQDNNFTYLVKGKYENNIVGLKLSIVNNIAAGISKDANINSGSFVKNGITLESIGTESDNFVAALAKIYELKSTSKFSKKPVKVTVFPLNENTSDLSKPNYYKFKAFFNDEADENDYAELFINLNLGNNTVEFNEKDSEYRTNVLKSLCEN